ncbi:hypothetical protein SGRIM128S_07856 [Streptomyces griseomycini]
MHADRGSEHPGTGVGNPGGFEGALNLAVLAPKPVQAEECHVDTPLQGRERDVRHVDQVGADPGIGESLGRVLAGGD